MTQMQEDVKVEFAIDHPLVKLLARKLHPWIEEQISMAGFDPHEPVRFDHENIREVLELNMAMAALFLTKAGQHLGCLEEEQFLDVMRVGLHAIRSGYQHERMRLDQANRTSPSDFTH